MSSFGANIAFIEELYEKFQSDPQSVSASWREFFQDYDPSLEEEDEQEHIEQRVASVGSVASVARPAEAPVAAPKPAPAPTPRAGGRPRAARRASARVPRRLPWGGRAAPQARARLHGDARDQAVAALHDRHL